MVMRNSTRAERFMHRLPVVIIEYPFEIAMATWAIVSALPAFFGLARPPSLISQLPEWAFYLWAALLFASGLSIAAGLMGRWYDTFVARGLELLGIACLCYGIAQIGALGWWARSVLAGLMFILTALCFFRAIWLQARETLHRRITAAARNESE